MIPTGTFYFCAMNFPAYAQQYHQNLLERIVPFWLQHSLDTVFGGYWNVISAKGEVITTDKWLQWHGQQAWAFVQLYQFEPNQAYLDYAKHGADLLLHYGTDTKENWWEVIDGTGKGLQLITDTRTEAAAVMAWAALYQITQEHTYADAAKKTILKAFKRREKLLQKRTDDISTERNLKNLGELTALAHALTAAEEILGEKVFREKTESLLQELMRHFWEPRAEIMLENVFAEGGFSDCLLGRRIHPGRVFEAFNTFEGLMKSPQQRRMRQQLAKHILLLAETTWDEAYGGYFHWRDVKNRTLSEPDAYFKYAWVHLEASTALLKAYQVLQDRSLLRYWQRTHDYLWHEFTDNTPEGEWIGVLSRHAEPLFQLKATPEKSAYYPIKNLLDTAKLLLGVV